MSASSGSAPGPLRRVLASERGGEVFRFLVSGGLAYLSDLVVFNVLLFSGVDAVWSKVVSSAVGIAIAFVGSRYYTWRDRRSDNPLREYAVFVVLSVIAAGIQLLCLAVTHHGFGWTSPLADNLSGNVFGMGLAMVFRFFTFRSLVFPDRSASASR